LEEHGRRKKGTKKTPFGHEKSRSRRQRGCENLKSYQMDKREATTEGLEK